MSFRELLAFSSMLILSGCLYGARERTDATVSSLVSHPFDVGTQPQPIPGVPPTPNQRSENHPATAATDVQTTAFLQTAPATDPFVDGKPRPRMEPKIPAELPGSEARPITLPEEEEPKKKAIQQLYPELPALPAELKVAPGPEGRPYTLADLHQIAAANSPELRQAAADVEAAEGALIQARTYPNPIVSWQMQPSNDGSTTGLQGPGFDQVIKTGGKLKLASAAAEMDLQNARLSLRRARSDLAMRVRTAYYGLLVAKETVRVTRSLAQFTDQIYRLHTGMLGAGLVAPYEPMALRAQAYTARLAHEQSIQNYIYAWKQLVAAIGLRQLPLSEVAGRIDTLIPYYDYDTVLTYVLQNHTDVLIARNGIDRARYNLKLAQVTPVPDVDVNVAILKEYVVPPKQVVPTASIGIPFPLWDQNKGNIISAEAALIRASEEPHRVELVLTENLSTAYSSYRTNLEGLEYYRVRILPDLVRAYRGVLSRRQAELNPVFADLFSAQQALAAGVTGYLGVLNSLWTSVVNVAGVLQTDDLFQLAQPRELQAVPDLEHLMPWPCYHPGGGPPVPASPQPAIALPPQAAKSTAEEPRELRPVAPDGREPAGSVSISSSPIDRQRAEQLIQEATSELQANRYDAARNLTEQAAAIVQRGDRTRVGGSSTAEATQTARSFLESNGSSEATPPSADTQARKRRAVQLLDRGLAALEEKHYDDAEQLGREAIELRVEWGKHEYRPESLLEEVRSQRGAVAVP